MCNFVGCKNVSMNKRKPNKWLRVGAIALMVAAIGVGAWLWPYAMTGAPDSAMLKIRRGSSTSVVTDSLERSLDVTFARRVGRLLQITGSDLSGRQGAFEIKKGDSPLRVVRLLRSGAPSGIKFTFNNVRTRDEFATRWGAKFMAGRDAMLKLLSDSAACAAVGRTPDNVVGLFQPDSYEFYWDITPEQFLEKMKGFHDRFWTDERLAKARAEGLTPEQVEVIASIVEEETAKADERPMVARLYMNRIATGMPLQADPTVKFAIGDFSIRRLTIPMTRTVSPYNTYINRGLPPGPIRLPEKATLDAVLNAPKHDYIYMCAKEDFSGRHNFAVDYAAHQANARRYQAALNARNIH